MTSSKTEFLVTVENMGTAHEFASSGAFAVPEGADEPGPLMPGGRYSFELNAAPGARLSFATMFVQSNDLFFAPAESGIPLFGENGDALSGDITGMISLWDAGTEENQEPGAGSDQAPMQAAPDTGAADPDSDVRIATDDFGNLPEISDVIEVTVTPGEGNRFSVSIENVSTATTLSFTGGESPVFLAPGVWAVHGADAGLFASGGSATVGLEALAEDGNPEPLSSETGRRTGLTSPLAPGAYAVHMGGMPMFSSGENDRGDGLEALAEDGDPAALAAALMQHEDVVAAGAFDTPAGGSEPAPALPGQSYQFSISAEPGDSLSLATMLVQSNDLFYAFDGDGLPLFASDGTPMTGDVTAMLQLWDAGSEVNEAPGAGPNQAPRQAAVDSGTDEALPVAPVDDDFDYPATDEQIRVTITAQ